MNLIKGFYRRNINSYKYLETPKVKKQLKRLNEIDESPSLFFSKINNKDSSKKVVIYDED